MTREDAIKSAAEAMHRQDFGENIDWGTPIAVVAQYKARATAAYDAMAEHIRAREEAVREMCAEFAEAEALALSMAADQASGCSVASTYRSNSYQITRLSNAIRALDIGGKTDG